MIDRYSTPEMQTIFSDVGKFSRYLEIELLATDAQSSIGVVSPEAAKACRANAPRVDDEFVRRVLEREAITNHDVAAFVDVVQAAIGQPHGAWIHHGLTSSDVVDTAWCWMLRDAADLIIDALDELIRTTASRAGEHRNTVMMGRTHGMHAEPTTFGAKLALFALQLDRDRTRLRSSRQSIAVCKLSGAVGTFSNIDPRVEEQVGTKLGLAPVPATQVISRDRHAEFVTACASLGNTIEAVATELRHLQRTEVGEVREGFGRGQKGSSAMPHKRNPISAETLSGLSRVLRGHVTTVMQNVALWHERDISHSSAERIILPDAAMLAFYMTRRLTTLLDGLEVDASRMRENIDAGLGLTYSQSILLALVDAGHSRDDAYRLVQEAAMRAQNEKRQLRAIINEGAGFAGIHSQLDRLFDEARLLQHAGRAVDAVAHLA